MKILERYTKEELIVLLNNSYSFRDFLIKVNSSSNGSAAYKSIKKQLVNIGIDIPISYRKLEQVNKTKSIRKNNIDIFVENSDYNRCHVKKRIINENIIEYVCKKCNNKGEWIGEVLSLHLEHINGIGDDNRLENLCFLCPNCHSQTETYSDKKLRSYTTNEYMIKDKIKRTVNERKKHLCDCGSIISRGSVKCKLCAMSLIRKAERPTYEILIKEIEELGYSGTGRKYGVSDNSIRKWIRKYENENTLVV